MPVGAEWRASIQFVYLDAANVVVGRVVANQMLRQTLGERLGHLAVGDNDEERLLRHHSIEDLELIYSDNDRVSFLN